VSAEIGNCVTSIGGAAFIICESLTSIDIPNSVTSIGDYAFQYCSGLTSCTIGSGVTSIGDGVFSGCYSLTNITVEATTPPTLYASPFEGDCPCSGGSGSGSGSGCSFTIYVPSDSVDTYKSDSYWSNYCNAFQSF
jgi:hypothetical protein